MNDVSKFLCFKPSLSQLLINKPEIHFNDFLLGKTDKGFFYNDHIYSEFRLDYRDYPGL